MGDKRVFSENFGTDLDVANNGGVTTSVSVNNGALFDTNTDKIIYSQTEVFNNKELTVKLVFTPNFDNDSGAVHYFYDSYNNRNYILLSGSTGNLQITFNDKNVANIASAIVKAAWKTNEKNTLYVSSVSGNTSVFLNGTKIQDSNTATWSPDYMTEFTVGNNHTPTVAFIGTLHEFSVYHTAWTDQEVEDDYAGTTYSSLDASKSLIYLTGRNRYTGTVEYTENLGTVGDLICGDGTTRTTFPTFNPPKEISFDGGDYLETDGTVDFASTDSYLLHCRFTSTGVGFIMDNRDTSLKGIACYINGTGAITVASNGTSATYITTTEKFNDGIERDLVVVWNNIDSTNLQASIYIDGELIRTQSLNVPTAITSTIRIGNSKSFTPFQGTMKDVGFWRASCTPRQVRYINEKSLKTLNV